MEGMKKEQKNPKPQTKKKTPTKQLVVLNTLKLWYCGTKNKSIISLVLKLPWVLVFPSRPIEVEVTL